MKYLVANWKSNKTFEETKEWITRVKQNSPKLSPTVETIICPSCFHLSLFKELLPEITLGTQDLSPFGSGPYTGAVSADQLKGLVNYAILGHSERRHYFGVTNQLVGSQALRALENNIIPIIAIDKSNWRSQFAQWGSDQLARMLIMYEPPEAISQPNGDIGEGESTPINEVLQVIKEIQAEYQPKAILYGGSVKSANVIEYLKPSELSGVVVGSASLDASEWLKIINQAREFITSDLNTQTLPG